MNWLPSTTGPTGDNISDEYYAGEKAAAEHDLAALHAIPRDQLNATDQLAYDVFDYSTKDTLRGQSVSAPPLRLIETRKPVSSRTFADGSIVYDLGQNTSYMPRIRVSGPAGGTVRLTPS